MTPTQKAAMQAALGCLVRAEAMYRQPNAEVQDALRAALAEPVVELEQPAVTDEIVLAACRKIAPTLFTRGLTPLDTDGPNWRQRMSDVENTVRVVLSFAAPQPQQPAEVPLLTDGEIRTIFLAYAKNNAHGVPYMTAYLESAAHLVRQVEQAVRQKAGLK